MTEQSNFVIQVTIVSDAELDAGWPTSYMEEVSASSGEEAVAKIKEKFGDRLLDVGQINEWPPGSFERLLNGIKKGTE